MLTKIIKHIIILLFLFLGTGCTPIYKTCLFGGCYGPLEIVIKTENGEHVEDIIVSLAHITADGFEGLTHTYKERVIGNTGEVIRFPRGYMYRSDTETLSLHFSVYHPDYHASELYVSVPNKSGMIDLGVRKIVRSTSSSPGISPNYFSYLISLKREDLVDKYLPERIKILAEYYGYTEGEIIELKARVRREIKEKASRL